MTVFLNGEFVPEERAVVSVFDRSFRYGDGIFEAVLIRNGKLFRWPEHFERLRRSSGFLKIQFHLDQAHLQSVMIQLAQQNGNREGMARVTLSRGVGPRGYAPSGTEKPNLVVTTEPAPPMSTTPWKLITSSARIAAGDSIAQNKAHSRLANVLAAMEARERGADEALLVNTDGHVTECTASNVFWFCGEVLHTPPVTVGALPGITRAVVIEICRCEKIPFAEQNITPMELKKTDGVFVTMSSRGVVEVSAVDGEILRRSPRTAQLAAAFQRILDAECP
jgi:branched-chain amino acid aminotransferase